MRFNKPAVDSFYNLLASCMKKHSFPPDRIYNVDETGLTCVAKSQGKITAVKGRKQVGKLSSAERGQNVTATICFSAAKHYVPLLLIYPRKRLAPTFLTGTPPSTYGVTHPSEWIQSEIFVKWIQHLIKHTKPTEEHPVLLLLDGHATHVKNLAVLELARKNFITVLCFPPHTTHKLQPLDVSFMRPLSMYYSQEINIYLLNHPGRVVTLHEIGKIFVTAYNKAATVKNAVSGFNKTGIYPYNPEAFSEEDFIAADTTDIPMSTSTDIESSSNLTSSDTTDIPVSTLTNIESLSNLKSKTPSTSTHLPNIVLASTAMTEIASTLSTEYSSIETTSINPTNNIMTNMSTPQSCILKRKSFEVSLKDIIQIPKATKIR
ncbi:uncharacterized protein LOC132925532 [Rhopalosiphum padi]|uniref:uncharacterized protein LOC132925532 n=1 Tax=Rhopalosiphum padi TaxID=40932 RepID=UPI00298EC47D|nr:uncharacterized protein LOC132925532 [Rhopalosiphum padi]